MASALRQRAHLVTMVKWVCASVVVGMVVLHSASLSPARGAETDVTIASLVVSSRAPTISGQITNSPARTFSSDDLANAFAIIYGTNRIDRDANGFEFALTPRRLVPVTGHTVALISEGAENPDTACHVCVGTLRIDYVEWDGNEFSLPKKRVKFDLPGASWGAPPSWTIVTHTLPTRIRTRAGFTQEKCTEYSASMLTLTGKGVIEAGSKTWIEGPQSCR